MVIKTYTNRSNARRAGVAAGKQADQIEITVHKSPQGVRFGWRHNAEIAQKKVDVAEEKSFSENGGIVQRPEKNGIKRPAAGGVCAGVWDWLDANPGATVKMLREIANAKGWNSNNATCEFYAWRKFSGIAGRALNL